MKISHYTYLFQMSVLIVNNHIAFISREFLWSFKLAMI